MNKLRDYCITNLILRKAKRASQTMLSLHSIVDLISFSNNWKIHVKVIHLWKQKTVGGGETIEMILFDVKVFFAHIFV